MAGDPNLAQSIAQLSVTPSPALVDVFRRVRQDGRNDPPPADVADPFVISFTFDGDGQLPIVGDALIQPLGRISARIVGASIVADGIATATIDVECGNINSWPVTAPLTPTVPAITGAAAVELVVGTGWIVNFQPGDIIAASLRSAVGTFTTITLTLECVRLKWPSGSTFVATSGGGSTLVTTVGAALTFRN